VRRSLQLRPIKKVQLHLLVSHSSPMQAGEIDFGVSDDLHDLLSDAIDRPDPAAALAP
jgi:hypothetical protein